MDGKDRRHECASPKGGGQTRKHEKESDSSRGVEQNITEMMSPSAEAEHCTIEHMRNRSDWMTVTSMSMSKCPNHSIPTQARDYLRSFIGVGRIIIVHEGKVDGLSKDEPNERNKTDADAGDEPTSGNFIAHFASLDRGMVCAADKDRHPPESERRDHARLERSPAPMRVAQFRWLSRIGRPARKPPQVSE